MPDESASLQNLHDIVIPDEVSWWPPAPGWFIVTALVVAALGYHAWRRYRTWKADAYRRAALRELATARTAAEVGEVLRRTALAIAPRETIAGLHGASWTDWLASRCAEPLPETLTAELSRSIYQPASSSNEVPALRDFASHWIRSHSRPC